MSKLKNTNLMMKKRHLNFQLFPFKIAAVDGDQQAILRVRDVKQDHRSGYILSIVLLLLFCLSINTLKAQTCTGGTASMVLNGTMTVNGVAITSASTGIMSIQTPTYSVCGVSNGLSPNSLVGGANFMTGQTGAFQTVFTFSQPVNDIIVVASAFNPGESCSFTSNGGAVSITANSSCLVTVSGNTITGSGGDGGGGTFRLTSPTPFTTLTWSGPGTTTAPIIMSFCSASIVACNANSPAPALTANTLTTTCPSGTANLNSLHTATPPSGSQLVWYTNSSHTGAAYATPTAATPGTYYAFYSSSASCYSLASSAVTVSSPAGPAFATNLTTGTNSECQNKPATPLTVAASGVSYQWYSNTTNSNVGGTAISGANSASYTP